MRIAAYFMCADLMLRHVRMSTTTKMSSHAQIWQQGDEKQRSGVNVGGGGGGGGWCILKTLIQLSVQLILILILSRAELVNSTCSYISNDRYIVPHPVMIVVVYFLRFQYGFHNWPWLVILSACPSQCLDSPQKAEYLHSSWIIFIE